MSEKIASALDYHFDKHRIVFWYDDGGKLKDVYEAAMVQQELEVPYFKNVHDRLLPLRSMLRPNTETEESLLLAMMSVLCGNTRESRGRKNDFPEIVLHVFLDTLIRKNPTDWAEIEKYSLNEIFWHNVKNEFVYSADTPTIEGFACYLFQTAFSLLATRVNRPPCFPVSWIK